MSVPEPIILNADTFITFIEWSGGLAATLEMPGLTITLADDVTGDLVLEDIGGGDMLVSTGSDIDYIAAAALLLAQMDRCDEQWSSPDRTVQYVRIHRWVLTVSDPTEVEHISCYSPIDAHALFEDWVLDGGAQAQA